MSEETTGPVREPRTLEEIQGTIRSARDSVWVVTDTIAKIAGENYTRDYKGDIERNVGHLRIVTADAELVASGEDIADLLQAIEDGDAALASWPAVE
jgi:hypothetical protein